MMPTRKLKYCRKSNTVFVYNQKTKTLQECPIVMNNSTKRRYLRIAYNGSILSQRFNIIDLKPADNGHHKRLINRCHLVLFSNKILAQHYIDKINDKSKKLREFMEQLSANQ
jgi:hypothetical protein